MGEEFELKKPEMCVVGPDGEPHALNGLNNIREANPELEYIERNYKYVLDEYWAYYWLAVESLFRKVDIRKLKRYQRRFIKAFKKYTKEKKEKGE